MNEIYRPEIAVIGGGLAGSSAALELVKRGAQVTVFERRREGFSDNMRSEVTLPPEIYQIGGQESINSPVTNVLFISLDNDKRVELSVVPESSDPLDSPAISIDHTKLIKALHKQLSTNGHADIEYNSNVTELRETNSGVQVVSASGKIETFTHAIDASGSGWKQLPFPDGKRQQQYEDSLVAVAYGKRVKGKILLPNGEKMFLTPQSAKLGTGKLSWVVAAGNDRLEVVYSDYSQRKNVGQINGKESYEKLRDILISRGIIEIDDEIEQETIAGFYGLEPRRRKTGSTKVFHHGDKGQYTAASTGDSISATIRLSPILAEQIMEGKTADDYYEANGKMFNHKLEMAAIMTKYHANTVGGGMAMIKAVQKLSIPEQHEFIRTHKFPLKYLPETILKNPHLLLFVKDMTREYFAQFLRR